MRIQRRLDALKRTVLQMAHSSEKMFLNLKVAIETEDLNLAKDIVEADLQINHYEMSIHEQAVNILSLLQPVASDLRYVLSSIKIANDLERMADYAKNIASFINADTITFLQESAFIELLNHLLLAYEEMLVLLKKPDSQKALTLVKNDENIDAAFENFFCVLSELSAESDEVLALASLGSQIERAGDHIKNICEELIYLKTGDFFDFG